MILKTTVQVGQSMSVELKSVVVNCYELSTFLDVLDLLTLAVIFASPAYGHADNQWNLNI